MNARIPDGLHVDNLLDRSSHIYVSIRSYVVRGIQFRDRKELTNEAGGAVHGDEDLAERRGTGGGIRRCYRDLSLRPQAGKGCTKFMLGKSRNLTFVPASAFNLREQSIKRSDDRANFDWNPTGLDRTHVVGVSALKLKSHRTQWSKPAIEARPDKKAQEGNDEKRRGQQSLDKVGEELPPDSQPVADEYAYPFSRNFLCENTPCDAINQKFRETRFTIAQARARGAPRPCDKPAAERPNLAVYLPP